MFNKTLFPVNYPQDFEAFWVCFSPTKNSSKSDAFKAFLQVKNKLPSQEIFLAETELYNAEIRRDEKKFKREQMKLHPATFLRQRRFENFEEDAKALLAARGGHLQADQSETGKTWAGETAKALALALDPYIGNNSASAILERWFYPCRLIRGESPEIACPGPFHARELEKRFGRAVRKVFGESIRITVAERKTPQEA